MWAPPAGRVEGQQERHQLMACCGSTLLQSGAEQAKGAIPGVVLKPAHTLGRGGSCRPASVRWESLCLLASELELPESQGFCSEAGGRCLAGERPRPRAALACRAPICPPDSVASTRGQLFLARTRIFHFLNTSAQAHSQPMLNPTPAPCGTPDWRAHGAAAPAALPSLPAPPHASPPAQPPPRAA